MEVPSWTIERFGKHLDRSEFDCGKPLLADWIKQQASQHETRGLARTYVLIRPGQLRVFGYYAIATCQLRHADLPANQAKGLPSRMGIPAALLGRLAVDRSVRGQGLGVILLMDAMRRVGEIAEGIGIRFLAVDALDDEARGFYVHHGFEEMMDDPRHLLIPVETIRQLRLSPPSG